MEIVKFTDLKPIERIMLYEAEVAMKKAYCPYSNYTQEL